MLYAKKNQQLITKYLTCCSNHFQNMIGEVRKCVVVDKCLAQKCRRWLEKAGLYDDSRKVRIEGGGVRAELPILAAAAADNLVGN